MKTVVWVCVLLLLAGTAAEARVRRLRPIQVRMVAYIGTKLAGTRPDFTWEASCRGKRYTLYVLKLDVLTGNTTALDIDAAIRMYPVQFQIAGNKEAMDKFVAAPAHQQVTMIGFLRLDAAARYFMLDSVAVAYLPTPAPTGRVNGPG